jgi:hypothetical protein
MNIIITLITLMMATVLLAGAHDQTIIITTFTIIATTFKEEDIRNQGEQDQLHQTIVIKITAIGVNPTIAV